MRIDVVTLFPNMFKGFLKESIVKRAQTKRLVTIKLHNLRDYTLDKHRKVDDRPFGGGPGMVLMVEPIVRAIEAIEKTIKPARRSAGGGRAHKILFSPAGRVFSQARAKALAKRENLILLCGHYEGFDERIKELIEFEELSIGKYVLSGGEIPAAVVIDSVIRLVPNVLGNPNSAVEESFSKGDKLDFPNYTRPRVYKGIAVPEVLLSGNHDEINKWRSLRANR
ncbi:MAG: tRNA (guanosine(37)-N1)-methyltransferase TrmD [Planctomycetes bacterium]|nr:tRNA (guanosine(37)-N1)-methyltransferase TrmD [Planctomycetota bacterium]